MGKSFRDKLADALAKKNIAIITSHKPVEGATTVDLVTAEVAFKHFWGKSFQKEIIWSNAVSYAYTGVVYIAGHRFTAQGKTKKAVTLRLAKQFCDTVPIYTASGKEIERQEWYMENDNG